MIYEALLLLFALLAVLAARAKDLLAAAIFLGVGSFVLAAIFFILRAPDIAITQAVAEAGIGTIIFVIAIKKTRRLEK